MRTRILCLFVGFLPVILLQAQDKTNKVPEPEYMNELYYLNDSNMLKGVEKGEAVMKTKTKLGGFGGSSAQYVLTGTASPFRTSNTRPSFVIKMGNTMMMDPLTAMRLYKFEKKDKQRQAMISNVGVMGKGSSDNQAGIKFNMKQSAQGTYILIPEKPLEPGEYGFINMMTPASSGGRRGEISYSVFAFGIDQ